MTASHGTATTINTYKFSIGVSTESTYSYDMQGNLVRQTTPDAGTESYTYTPQGQIKSRTTATGVKIDYKYSMDRLTSIKYSDSSDSVAYIYSDSTAFGRQKCRLVEVRDASGTERYTYGDMGVITKTVRTINIDTLRHLCHTYVYGAEYDSWGRVREMTYPDGEKVVYSYYPTGELKSITGQNNGKEDAYLVNTGYNVYGQTAYRKMGNGTEHIYAFDENNRLENSTLQMHGQTITSNTYRYDGADNITDITQIGGGYYYQHYEYDDLDRLVKATGRDNTPYGDAPYGNYSMKVAYNIMSSPVKIEKNLNGTFIRNEYLYGLEEHPNAPQQVGERRYTYSASGNPLTIEGSKINRTLTWDAENRLRRISDSRSGQLHLYTYNHLGERALKRFGKAQTMAVNDKDAGALLDTKDNYSAYVSPYFVGHNNRYTKHYYAGTMRLASKIGGAVYKGADGEQADLEPGSTYTKGTDEPDLYYYFTDHLGSTTYITDRKEVAQYVAYTPYGETFKEYKNVTPYKFNGKELDQETGYYYYGARYYDPSTALWFGTDPLAHINPQVSPYVYCKSNPVCRIDLDGRADWQAVYDGSLSVVGGALSCIAGGTAACTPTGVGQVAGAVLISTGIVGMGLGTTQIIAGFVDVPNASNIPTGCVEAIGMVSDAVFNLDKCQTVGGYVDMGVGISATKAAGQSLNIVDILSITSSVVYDYSNIATFTKSNVSNNSQFICNPDRVRVQQPLIKEAIHQDEK